MNLLKKPPGEPLLSHSTMKKTFPKKPNVPLSPLLLLPFHISREKKTLPSTPSPSTVKKRRKKTRCTFSPIP